MPNSSATFSKETSDLVDISAAPVPGVDPHSDLRCEALKGEPGELYDVGESLSTQLSFVYDPAATANRRDIRSAKHHRDDTGARIGEASASRSESPRE
ncbi:MAG TPA: hypothetical protein VKT78_08130 [Fimbriimonadaceae bacterium]|nr:hypothetical protein [Fimbriimonadaceae bacterium]